jgi:hypothetical protein
VEGVDHGTGRCQLPLGEPSALGDEGRVHSRFQSVEVLPKLLTCFAGLEPRPAKFGGITGLAAVGFEDGPHGALEPVSRCQLRQPSIDSRQNPVLGQK